MKVELGPVKTRLYGRHGYVHDLGDLLIRMALELVEDKHFLLLFRQRGDRLPDERSRLVQCQGGSGVDSVRGLGTRPAPGLVLEVLTEFCYLPEFSVISVEVPAPVDRDPIDPGGDEAIMPECRGRSVDLKEDVLGDILGILRVAEQAGA